MKLKSMLIVLLATICLLTFSTTCFAAETDLTSVISVSGEGVVKLSPNMADINFSVITEANDAGLAQAKNTELVTKVINSLRDAGIAAADISTSGYYLNPQYIYEEGKSSKISGYMVRNEITVTVRDTASIGKIIDLAVKSGINQVQNIRFYIEGSTAQKTKALTQAIEDARVKAEVIAAALGKKIVGIKSASGNWYDNAPQPIYFEKAMDVRMGGDSISSTPINPGMVEIRANAEMVYLIN
ncbi:26 kDa periplasmic immunogenic protein precursor [Sporotomaculum syntrophicum]|uniref:26 kDa periplasmic immunogenic protein n=1 Tax=Sporotomaculum syntrophicum TaxID=182264 RepID=A0A9D3AWS7_9FIRM|nr:SIMPL domain-containing protein [Sporotomaculum syntrophicum]KAF1084192.1 26 kDa periplasmic immunogenic protein precursor [Sporotomaculum syntrophicum]